MTIILSLIAEIEELRRRKAGPVATQRKSWLSHLYWYWLTNLLILW